MPRSVIGPTRTPYWRSCNGTAMAVCSITADSANSRVASSPDRCIETLRRIFGSAATSRAKRCALRCSRTFSQSE